MKTYDDIWACPDCYLVFHYGFGEAETSEDYDVNAMGRFYDEYGFHSVTDNADDEEGIREFSKAPCDICKSHLAGSRYRLALWDEEVQEDFPGHGLISR